MVINQSSRTMGKTAAYLAADPHHGGRAFKAGQDVRTNPYYFDTADYFRWHAEWFEAQAEACSGSSARQRDAQKSRDLAARYRQQESSLRQIGGNPAPGSSAQGEAL
jgi:hypothetical protein